MSESFHIQTFSPAARLGLKGPDAPALLERAGIELPTNSFLHAPDASLSGLSRCLRLGNTEFLLEQDDGDEAIRRVYQLANSSERRAWPVLRSDFCILIHGTGALERLSRLCSFDFARLDADPGQVVMTLLADISVTLLREPANSGPASIRLWTDISFGEYLTETLANQGVHA